MARSRGTALLMVLWLLVLLVLLAASTLNIVQGQNRSRARAIEALQSKASTESVLNRTIQLLSDTDPRRHPGTAGRFEVDILDRTLAVALTDETGRDLTEVIGCDDGKKETSPQAQTSYAGRVLSLAADVKDFRVGSRAVLLITGDTRRPALVIQWPGPKICPAG